MAFFNRLGNLLKQTVRNNNIRSGLSASSPSLYKTIRNMASSNKIIIQGLPGITDEASLKEAFSKHGEVTKAYIVRNECTGISAGLAFVHFTSIEAVCNAIQAFDGQDLHGQKIKVDCVYEMAMMGDSGGGGGSDDVATAMAMIDMALDNIYRDEIHEVEWVERVDANGVKKIHTIRTLNLWQ